MSLDDLTKLLTAVGFPAAVAAFVLIRLEARLKELTAAVDALRLCLDRERPYRHSAPPPKVSSWAHLEPPVPGTPVAPGPAPHD